MNKYLYLLLVLVFVGVACKSSTGPSGTTTPPPQKPKVIGVVRDSANGMALSSADVGLFTLDTIPYARTLSDANGKYEFDSVAAGSYFLVADRSGYGTAVSIIRVTADSDVHANIYLGKEQSYYDQVTFVVISATTKQPLANATVTDASYAYPYTVDYSGRVTIGGSSGTHTFTIDAPDYVSQTVAITFPVNDLHDTIALVPHVDTLIARYTFNNNAVDSSGNGHDGFLHGGTFVFDRFGQANSALQFNGSTDYVSVPSAPDLNFGNAESFSLCFWIKCQAQAASSARYVLRKMDSTSGMFLGYHAAYNQYYDLISYCGTTAGSFNGPSEAIGDDNMWHFITYVYDETGTVSLYSDGMVSPYSQTSTDIQHALRGPMPNNSPLMIGSDGSSRHAFKGTIDDIRIYRGALSSSKINTLFHENGW